MYTVTDIAVVGAGPYGLSLAAHLGARQADMQVFGKPMGFWRDCMPEGMVLKSEGFASALYDPGGNFTLRDYCGRLGLPYADTGLPVPLDTFIGYGRAFQQRFVPALDTRRVMAIRLTSAGYTLELEDGQRTAARRVVIAAGIQDFAFTPPELAPLHGPRLSHASAHRSLSRFVGRRVLVIGGGASGIELAALLHAAGARVTVAARHARIGWCSPPGPRSLTDRMQAPLSGLGTGWRSLACVKAPLLFHALPAALRATIVARHLGPSPGWTSRDGIEGKVPVLLGAELAAARLLADAAEVSFRLADGTIHVETADDVIAATGYRTDLQRMEFLDPRSAPLSPVTPARRCCRGTSNPRSPACISSARPRPAASAHCCGLRSARSSRRSGWHRTCSAAGRQTPPRSRRGDGGRVRDHRATGCWCRSGVRTRWTSPDALAGGGQAAGGHHDRIDRRPARPTSTPPAGSFWPPGAPAGGSAWPLAVRGTYYDRVTIAWRARWGGIWAAAGRSGGVIMIACPSPGAPGGAGSGRPLAVPGDLL